ncbi:Protein CapL [uncultured delta proteobacterium]|uniref:Protein CapL n=1 Tax=uncultured delta proteobacterium TaxID=34034 RepID=A0A212JVI2_9DELT|nr:Protein CapL [uncultured delta proteobacterium]
MRQRGMHRLRKTMTLQFADFKKKKLPVAVVGLGYVGLPLAVALARHFAVIGFDVAAERVAALASGRDHTGEVDDAAMAATTAQFTTDPAELARARVIIVAVPTPVDNHKTPDLTPVTRACATVGRAMAKGSVVVFESTVYPGVTEDVCVPILEKESGLVFGRDFTVGYSPERINPGDKVHTLESVVKIVAGSDEATRSLLAKIYGAVVKAGIHEASSIKVAEAAKVIENTQRDLNIALMNELSVIFHNLGIDTMEVLEAAGTKWNFLPFRPGLVGGHCIGVDPYYLTYKAEETGYQPQVILAGRRINDSMGGYVAKTAVKMMIQAGRQIRDAKVGILGLTFKENVPDLRNSKVIDIITELVDFGATVQVHDPLADNDEAKAEYGVSLLPLQDLTELDALILAVGHEAFSHITPKDIAARFADKDSVVVLDVKAFWDKEAMLDAGYAYWRL